MLKFQKNIHEGQVWINVIIFRHFDKLLYTNAKLCVYDSFVALEATKKRHLHMSKNYIKNCYAFKIRALIFNTLNEYFINKM